MNTKPQLIVFVDTEEEFDWSLPLQQTRPGLTHLPRLADLQALFDRHRLMASYVCTLPVINSPVFAGIMEEPVRDGRVHIGAHLHPWLTPPVEEEICDRNSLAGNLPPELERKKLITLTEAVTRKFSKPLIYMSGRYGLGPKTYAHLSELGYLVDLSASPPIDRRPSFGPDYTYWPSGPFIHRRHPELYAIPCTGSLTGLLSQWRYSPVINRVFRSDIGRALRLPMLMRRSGLLDMTVLTPEGHGLRELKTLTRTLLRCGERSLAIHLHSPSLAPGLTPYARDEAGCKALLRRLDDYLIFFREELGGEFTDPLSARAAALRCPDTPVLNPPLVLSRRAG